MKTAFDATVEVIVARISNTSLTINEEDGKHIAEFAQVVYNKFKELESDCGKQYPPI